MIKARINSKLERVMTVSKPIKVIVGGRGCLEGNTLIDTPSGQVKIKDFKGGEVYSLVDGEIRPSYATASVKYSIEELYKVSFDDGSYIVGTANHRFFVDGEWLPLSSVCGLRLDEFSPALHPTSLDTSLLTYQQDVRHLTRTALSFLYCYLEDCYQYDGQLLSSSSTFQDVLPLLTDVLPHNPHAATCLGGLSDESINSLSLALSHLSILIFPPCEVDKDSSLLGSSDEPIASEQPLDCNQPNPLSGEMSALSLLVRGYVDFFERVASASHEGQVENLLIVLSELERVVLDGSYSRSLVSCNLSHHSKEVISVTQEPSDHYYDFHVPIYNNYLSCGVINHNSGKSIAVGDIMALKMESEQADVYCLREFQESVFDSVHRVIGASVTDRLKLKDWTIFENRIVSSRGARTRYAGASRNPSSLQSASNYKYSWFEEAQKASKESLDLLLPTIIRSKGAECWFTGNPMSSADPFSQRFINPYLGELETNGYYEDDLHMIVVVNWRDNPWWNEEQELLRLWDYENRPRAEYNWIWEGKFNDTVDDAIILPEWVDAAVDSHKVIQGIDRGSSAMGFDPADGGADDKALVCRKGGLIYKADAWTDGDVNDAIDRSFGIAYDENIAEVVFDEVGVGAAVKVGLNNRIANRNIKVTGFKGSERPDNPDSEYMSGILNENYFKNKRAQYSWLLRDRFEKTYRAIVKKEYIDPSQLISLSSEMPMLERIKSELVRVPRKWVSGSDMVQIMSKQEMRRNKIKSPNLFDALKMSFGTANIGVHTRSNIPQVPIINKRASAFRR